MSSDSEEGYEPWSDEDDEQQAPVRPAAPVALDAETLATLNSLESKLVKNGVFLAWVCRIFGSLGNHFFKTPCLLFPNPYE